MTSSEVRLSHTGNLLGALILALGDRMGAAVRRTGGGSETSAATLSSLRDFLDRPTVGRLQEVVGLAPSGAVRLVDRLEHLGLVARSPGLDGRTRHVSLTWAGARAAKATRAARAEVLESALDVLSPAERRRLDALLAKILAGLARPPGATRWTCRLCDTTACGRAQGRCPFVPVRRARTS